MKDIMAKGMILFLFLCVCLFLQIVVHNESPLMSIHPILPSLLVPMIFVGMAITVGVTVCIVLVIVIYTLGFIVEFIEGLYHKLVTMIYGKVIE